jgi:hypothetical protein
MAFTFLTIIYSAFYCRKHNETQCTKLFDLGDYGASNYET